MKDGTVLFSRRAAMKGAAAAVVLASTAQLEGCNANAWIQTAINDLPIVLQIVTTILQMAGSAGASAAGTVVADVTNYGNAAEAALKEAQTLIGQYQAAKSSDRPDLLGKIHAGLVTAQNNLNSILDVFHVTDATLASTVAAAVGSAITVVLAVETLIPPPPAPTATQAKLAKRDERETMKAAFDIIVAKRYPKLAI